jgi:hypothetical protein
VAEKGSPLPSDELVVAVSERIVKDLAALALPREQVIAVREGPVRLRPATFPVKVTVVGVSAHAERLWVTIEVGPARGHGARDPGRAREPRVNTRPRHARDGVARLLLATSCLALLGCTAPRDRETRGRRPLGAREDARRAPLRFEATGHGAGRRKQPGDPE